MFGIVDKTNKIGRPCREWMNDIVGPRLQKMETHYKTSNGHQRALVPWSLKKEKNPTNLTEPYLTLTDTAGFYRVRPLIYVHVVAN